MGNSKAPNPSLNELQLQGPPYPVVGLKIQEFLETIENRDSSLYSQLPPTHYSFAVVYTLPTVLALLRHPQLGINLTRLLHREQSFSFLRRVFPGDQIVTSARLAEMRSLSAGEVTYRLLLVVSESFNQHGELVCQGRWTFLVQE